MGKDINLPKEKSSQQRSDSSGGKGNKCDTSDRSGQPDPKVTATYPRVLRPEDPLQAAMRSVADRLRAAVDLPRGKRKEVLAELRLQWHPDKNPGDTEVATKVFQFMQELKDQ